MSNLTDAQVYARQLLLKRHGYPLWVPEPYGNSVAYRTKGIRIGDVGYITQDGAFETLFNLRAGADDPINSRGVPEGFERLNIAPNDIVHIPNFHQPDCTVTSASTKKRALDLEVSTPDISPVSPSAGTSIQFNWTSSEGAILHLPAGASRLTCPADLFRDAAVRGAKNWYKFANVTLRRGVSNGALYLVTGYDKTHSWMVGSFSDKSSDAQASFKLSTGGMGDARASYSYSWDTSSPAVYRTGPSMPVDSEDTIHRNRSLIEMDDSIFCVDAPEGKTQCVFLRGYRLMLRNNPVALVLGGTTKIEVNSISSTNPKDVTQSPVNRPYAHLSSQSLSFGELSLADKARHHSEILHTPLLAEDADEDVSLEQVPSTLEPYHPSISINKLLLHIAPHVDVSLIHDDEWCSVLDQDDSDIPDDTVLASRILEQYQCNSRTGAAFLIPRCDQATEPLRHLSDRQDICNPRLRRSPENLKSPGSYPSWKGVNPSIHPGKENSTEDAHSQVLLSYRATMTELPPSQRRSPPLDREIPEVTNTGGPRTVFLHGYRMKKPKPTGRPSTNPNPPTYSKHSGLMRRPKSIDTLKDHSDPIITSTVELYVSSMITVQ